MKTPPDRCGGLMWRLMSAWATRIHERARDDAPAFTSPASRRRHADVHPRQLRPGDAIGVQIRIPTTRTLHSSRRPPLAVEGARVAARVGDAPEVVPRRGEARYRAAMVDPSLEATKRYYDDFATWYENERRPNDARGYHALIDDLELGALEPFARGRDVLECGCGTGLLLERIAQFARTAEGVDLSPGMLEHARARGLSVREASVTALPYADASFDVACSFKVLAHVEPIEQALAEMARVVRPGGYVLAELYNGWSFRALAKTLGPAGRISKTRDESAVYTRFDPPTAWRALLPASLELEGVRGVRIVTAAAPLLRIPFVGGVLRALEHRLMATPAAYFAGFAVLVAKKRGA